jgi:putative tryptophan/tyrosine transport system substrate-binding protein
MDRRRFLLTSLASALAAPLIAEARQPDRIYRIGVLERTSPAINAANLDGFRRGLLELGYVEGKNYAIEYRSAEGHDDRFPSLAAELVRLKVDLILTRGTPAALAAKTATSTIPVVMASLGEPLLVVASLARPGGNITGLSGVVSDLDAKRIELLKEMAPATVGIAAFLNMSNPITIAQLKELEPAAQSKGLRFRLFDVRNSGDIERAFDTLDIGYAIVVGLDAVTQAHRRLIAELAAKRRVPAIYGGREFVESGGLMFYGPNFPDIYRRAAVYVDKIFKGAKPGDLPIEQPTKFELIINGVMAKALGLEVPPSVLLRADEVIE